MLSVKECHDRGRIENTGKENQIEDAFRLSHLLEMPDVLSNSNECKVFTGFEMDGCLPYWFRSVTPSVLIFGKTTDKPSVSQRESNEAGKCYITFLQYILNKMY